MAAVLTMNHPSRDMFQGYPQHYATDRSRTSNSPSTFPSYQFSYGSHTRQQQPYPVSYQHSHSPSFEHSFKPSLPSISNLLDIANTDRPAREIAPLEAPTQRHTQQQAPQTAQPRQSSPSAYQAASMHPLNSASHHRPERSMSSRLSIPPTPPYRGDSVLEGTQSPSTISSGSSLSTVQPYYLASALNNVEAMEQRMAPTQPAKRQSLPSQSSASPYATSPFASSPVTLRTQYSPVEPAYPSSGMYQQRPLPSNFPPPPPLPADTRQALPTSNPWEHHHYISSSSQASYPPPQDRYICQTCNKAFSRPSSLKIHSHSHTGEKPFKCPHNGCGKAFSVRSNMKRHERGCHARQPGLFPSPIMM